jgi:hypothetical protein
MWKYIGDGGVLMGVPMRDLTDEEAQQYGELVESSGYFTHVPDAQQKMNLGSRENKAITRGADENKDSEGGK